MPLYTGMVGHKLHDGSARYLYVDLRKRWEMRLGRFGERAGVYLQGIVDRNTLCNRTLG